MPERGESLSIGEIAVKLELITRGQLDECLQTQARRSTEDDDFPRLGDIMLEKDYVSKEQLIMLLGRQRQLTDGKNRIGRYETVNELGRGAMGVVFRATQMSLDREVALKAIPKGVGQDKAWRERFLREAKLAAKLSHPNIVKAIDAGETQQCFFFVMELFEAPDLLKVLRESDGPLDEQTVLTVARQMASALGHAEQNQLVHRDIKPENILFHQASGVAKLTDMGLAKSTDSEKGNITQAGSTLGTPHYIAPESIAAGKTVDIRADIYSLGASLYNLVTKELPFVGETVYIILKKVSEAKLVPPKRRNPKLSSELNRIILKCMERNLKKRYQTPAELLADLDTLSKLGPAKAFALNDPGTQIRGPKRPRKKGGGKVPTAAIVAAFVLVAAGALGLVAVVTSGGKDPQKNGKGEKSGRTKEPKKPGKGSDTPSGRKPPDQGETPEPAPPERVEKKQKAEFKAIAKFARSNPDNFDEIVSRYKALAGRAKDPDLAERAREQAAEWEKHRSKAGQVSLADELALAEKLRMRGEYGPAVNVLSALATKLTDGADLEKVKTLEKRYWAEARARSSTQCARARALARKGDYAGAVAMVEKVKKLGLPSLWEEVSIHADRYRLLEAEARVVAFHRSLVEVSLAQGLEKAQAHLDKAVREGTAKEAAFERSNLAKAGGLRDSMNTTLGVRKGRDLVLTLLSGEEVEGRLTEVEKDRVQVVDSTQKNRWIAVKDLDPSFAATGTPEGRYAQACYLWYLTMPGQRLRAWRVVVALPDQGGATAQFRGKMESVLSLDLRETVEDLVGGEAKAVFIRAADIIRRYRSTPFYGKVEPKLETAFSKAARQLGEDPEILLAFRGAVTREKDGRYGVTYDFQDPTEAEDFESLGAGTWLARHGALEQSEGGMSGEAMLASSWTEMEATARVLLHGTEGSAGLVLGSPGTPVRFLLTLSMEKGKPRVALRRVDAKGDETPVGRPLSVPVDAVRKDESGVLLKLIARAGKVSGEYTWRGRTRKTGTATLPEGTVFRPGVVAESRVAFLKVAFVGTLDPAWRKGLERTAQLKRTFASGKWTQLLPGSGKLDGWKKKGAVAAKADTVALSGERSDLSLVRARSFMGDGKNLHFEFQARRQSDLGWAAVRFTVGSRDIIWVLRPESEETRPYGVSEEHAVISLGPFEDGAWHKVLLEVGSENAKLYIDGVLREDFNADMLADLMGDIPTSGFGLTSFGGQWVFKGLRVRKLKK